MWGEHAMGLLDRQREQKLIARGTIGKREPLERGVQPGPDLDTPTPPLTHSTVRAGRVCWPIELPCLILIASGAGGSNMAKLFRLERNHGTVNQSFPHAAPRFSRATHSPAPWVHKFSPPKKVCMLGYFSHRHR